LIDQLLPETWWLDPRTGQNPFQDAASSKYTLPSSNIALSIGDVNHLGNCQQTATYNWGFSFLLLFIVLIFFLVWILGTYILWLDAYLHSRLDIVKRDMGLYRAALDISSVIQNDLDKNVDAMTPNSMLLKIIKADKKGGRIGLQSLNSALPQRTRMMSIHHWGRTGGYSRWTLRLTLPILIVLIIVISGIAPGGNQSTLGGLLILFLPLIVINILVLGHGRLRALSRKDSQCGISHHPLQSFEEEGQSPSDSRMSTTEPSISGREDNNTDNECAGRDPKNTASTDAVEIT